MKLINKTSILVLCISFLAAFGLISCGESGNNPPSELEEDNSNNNQDLDESEDEVSNDNYVLHSVVETTRISTGETVVTKNFYNPVYEVSTWSGRTMLKSYDKYTESPYSQFQYALPDAVTIYNSSFTMECSLNSKSIVMAKIGREKYVYEYDTKNRLIKITSQYGDLDHDIHIREFKYDSTFNLIGYKLFIDNTLAEEAEIEYSTVVAKTIPLQCYDSSYGNIFSYFGDADLLAMGFFGNSIPLYLVKRILFKDYSTNSENEKVFEYEVNQQGYVVEMVMMDYRVTQTFISTWKFEWEKVLTPSYVNWLFSDITSPYYRYLN